MATVNKASLRAQFDALKARFESRCAAGKISAECRALVDALLRPARIRTPPPAAPAIEPTAADLAKRYLTEHVAIRCKPRTAEVCRWLVAKFVLPELGKIAIGAVEREHIVALHYRHRQTPYQANRILEVVRKMFNLAEAWGLRKDGANPCRFVQKYKERKREWFLTDEEFRRLGQILSEVEAEGSETASAIAAIRLLMLTGCRLNEIRTLRWENVDLEASELQLPDSKTGARMVPLSRTAGGVLARPAALRRQSVGDCGSQAGQPSDGPSASVAAHPGARRDRRRADSRSQTFVRVSCAGSR